MKKPQKKKANNSNRTNLLYVALAVSIVLNLAYIVTPFILKKTGALDDAIVNNGVEIMCSDDYRNQLESKGATRSNLAFLDYSCGQNGSGEFFNTGYENYLKSLKIEDK